MTDHPIALHLKASLGIDVGVALDDDESPRAVTLYRPDQLPTDFVSQALKSLAETEPDAVRGLETVLVTFETPLGRTQRRIDLATADAHPAPTADGTPDGPAA